MKKSKRQCYALTPDWIALAHRHFGDLDVDPDFDEGMVVYSICDELAYIADYAHINADAIEIRDSVYNFVRWTIWNTEDQRIKDCMSDRFLSTLLSLPKSKKACVDYLNWGDVKLMIDNFTTEPSFEDIDNFDRLCLEWKKRWSKNQKLPEPINPAEQIAAPGR